MILNKNIVLVLFGFLLAVSVVKADCVVPTDFMEITKDTNFCVGEYEISGRIYVKNDNIHIFCNNTVFKNGGLEISANGVEVYNCIFKDFSIYQSAYPLSLDSAESVSLVGNIIENSSIGILITNSNNNFIFRNNISSNIGIWFVNGNGNFISQNRIMADEDSILFTALTNLNCSGNQCFEVFTDISSVGNKIFNNIFDKGGIKYIWGTENYQNLNDFCVNGISNIYLNGATGPTCPENNLEQRVTLLEQMVQTIQSAICTVHSFYFCGTTTTTIPTSTTTTIPSSTTTTFQSQCQQICQNWYGKNGVCRGSCLGGEKYNGLRDCPSGQKCCCV